MDICVETCCKSKQGRVCPSASCHSSRYSAEISQTSSQPHSRHSTSVQWTELRLSSLNIKDEAGLGVAAGCRVPRVARLRVPRGPGPAVRGARDQLLAEHRCTAGHVTRDRDTWPMPGLAPTPACDRGWVDRQLRSPDMETNLQMIAALPNQVITQVLNHINTNRGS